MNATEASRAAVIGAIKPPSLSPIGPISFALISGWPFKYAPVGDGVFATTSGRSRRRDNQSRWRPDKLDNTSQDTRAEYEVVFLSF
jgi:hypothetical protein